MATEIFEQLPMCVWEVTGYRIPIPVKKVSARLGNRIVQRARQNRDGAKLDDTGMLPTTYALEVDFYNGCSEEGMPSDDMYPGLPNYLEKSLKVHETGNLWLPRHGKRRCRLETIESVETFDERDMAAMVLNFTEDNEDAVNSNLFAAPSARSVARRLAELTTFSAEQNGVSLSDSGAGIAELANEVETLINSPFEYLGDLQAQAERVKSSAARALDVYTDRTTQLGELLSAPPGARAVRGLVELRDKAARVVEEKQSAMPRLVPYVVPSQRSIFDIAVQFEQDPVALLGANPQLGDPLAIPERTVVKVFER
jgi:prophage DNA circulation protein